MECKAWFNSILINVIGCERIGSQIVKFTPLLSKYTSICHHLRAQRIFLQHFVFNTFIFSVKTTTTWVLKVTTLHNITPNFVNESVTLFSWEQRESIRSYQQDFLSTLKRWRCVQWWTANFYFRGSCLCGIGEFSIPLTLSLFAFIGYIYLHS